ncbi:hypothetical protein [Priestia koreensis]|uniref:hypothetical protein n=1 Tax=Priestia koreensis TaxID=284581 RepID=UPI003459EA78
MHSLVPRETIQSICTLIFDPGKVPVLLYLALNAKQQTVNMIGTALFHHDLFSGTTLNSNQSKMLLILRNQKNKYMELSDTVNLFGHKINLSYNVVNIHSTLKIKENFRTLDSVHIPLQTDIELQEFTSKRPLTENMIKDILNSLEQISQNLAEL